MMKLLAYHIENYGKMHAVDGKFEDGVTCICEKNGFGKSTLASFIKAMFYGLPSYTAASKTFNDRQKYYPFEGGKFGGNLTFEYGGKIYRIERFFDKKSSKGDECRVLLGGAEYRGFGEDIGKTVFGVDEESFQKTAFITADEVDVSSTHSINEKLGGTVEGDGGFASAYKALEDARKTLKAARGSGGKINAVKQDIDSLVFEIKNLTDMNGTLAEEYRERERLTGEIAVTEKELERAAAHDVVVEKWKRCDELSAQKAEKTARLESYKTRYPLGFPTAEERRAMGETWKKKTRLSGSLQTLGLSEQKRETLKALEIKFKNGIPMVETTEQIQAKIGRLTALKAEGESLKNGATSERVQTLKARFEKGAPTQAEMETSRREAESLRSLENELKARTTELLNKTPAKKKFDAGICLITVGAIALAVGLGLLFVVQALGIALAALGAVIGVAGVAIKSLHKPLPPSEGEYDLAELQAEMQESEERLRAFTGKYGYAVHEFARLEGDLQEYRVALELQENRVRRLADVQTEAARLEEECLQFFARYGVTEGELQTRLNQLRQNVDRYRDLQAEVQNEAVSRREVSEQINECDALVQNILAKYGLPASVGTMDGLNGLDKAVEEAEKLGREIANLTRELYEYRATNELHDRPAGGVDTSSLRAQSSEKRKLLADCDKRIAETERQVEKLPELENALVLAREELETLNDKYELLGDTMSALKDAEQSLKDKYIKPIKDRFSAYAESLERVLDEKVSMTKDFQIAFERGGEYRSEKHLSAGERSLCALCLRLALVDNMYGQEPPFIIMDDPFVHLDETHMERTKSLLRELGKTKQIVYFCCHESRKA